MPRGSYQTPVGEDRSIKMIDVIGETLDKCKKWQLRTIAIVYLCKIPPSWFAACIIFTAPAPKEFYCRPTELSNISADLLANKSELIKYLHPVKEGKGNKEFDVDFCYILEDAYQNVKQKFFGKNETLSEDQADEPPTRQKIVPCDSFEYKTDYWSIITQFNLVCSKEVLVAVTQFFHIFGVLCGFVLVRRLRKVISPRTMMMLGMLTQVFCGQLTGWVDSYALHVFFRSTVASCCVLMFVGGTMIIRDIVTAGRPRMSALILMEQFWSVGVCLLPGIAHFMSSWAHLYMAISYPTLILVFLAQWVPDSPRWFLAHGYVNRAEEILREAVAFEGGEQPDDHLLQRLKVQAKEKEIMQIGFWAMWQNENKLKLFCAHLAWSCYGPCFFGMLPAIRALGSDYSALNILCIGLSEMIGNFVAWILVLHTNKKWKWSSILNLIGGPVAFTVWLIPNSVTGMTKNLLWIGTIMVAKCFVSTARGVLLSSTAELVTPEKRHAFLFSTLIWARTWNHSGPWIGALGLLFGKYVPQTVFGVMIIFGALCTLCIHDPPDIGFGPPQKKVQGLNLRSISDEFESKVEVKDVFYPTQWDTFVIDA